MLRFVTSDSSKFNKLDDWIVLRRTAKSYRTVNQDDVQIAYGGPQSWNDFVARAMKPPTRVAIGDREKHGIKESKDGFELYRLNAGCESIYSRQKFAQHMEKDEEPFVILNVQKEALTVAARLYSTLHSVYGEVMLL